MLTLDNNDLKILKHICVNKRISKQELLKKFPKKNYSLDFSLDLLVKSEYIELENFTNPGELFPKVTDNYIVTPLGDRYFKNEVTINKLEKKKYRSKLLIEIMRSIVFPTIVAFITAMLTTKFLK